MTEGKAAKFEPGVAKTPEPDAAKMTDSRAQPSGKAKPSKPEPAQPTDGAAPGELLTGEGDPGLTLTGGSGHA
jgi:hypothetical protein